jgi:hypothetical protein
MQYKVAHFDSDRQNEEDKLRKLEKDFDDFLTFFIKNRLYFEEELCRKIEKVNNSMSDMIDKYVRVAYLIEDKNKIREAGNEMIDARKEFRQQSFKDRKELEKEFRKLLSAELPNYQIEKKQ